MLPALLLAGTLAGAGCGPAVASHGLPAQKLCILVLSTPATDFAYQLSPAVTCWGEGH
jgi:hypothetical protein